MAPHRTGDAEDGHAVVLTGCAPNSLTFLNSWGNERGDNRFFSVEGQDVLEVKWMSDDRDRVRYYDVYWLENDPTAGERRAYDSFKDKAVRDVADKHKRIFDFEAHCPLCGKRSPLSAFTGSIREAVCPGCKESFKPEPGHLLQAIYARAGFGDVK